MGSIANWLEAAGVRQGDRVAIAMRNYPEWMLTYWACVTSGVGAVGMNAWWIGEEIDYALKDSAPKVLICDQERLDRFNEVEENFPDLKVVGVRLSGDADGVTPFQN